MTKTNVFVLCLLGIFCSLQGQTLQNKYVINPRLQGIYDSLMLYHKKDNKLIIDDFKEGLKHKVEKSTYPVEVITLAGNHLVGFSTSNNSKVDEVMNKLPNISPIEFLLELRNIEGEIKVSNGTFPLNWIQREHFPQLFQLADIDIKMPLIKMLSDSRLGGGLYNESSLKNNSYVIIPGTCIGHTAVIMMDSYANKVNFPWGSNEQLTKLKIWYDSGKTQDEYINTGKK